MRWKLVLAAAAVVASCGFALPAMAGGWDRSPCCGGTVYVHHHVYYPPVYKHVYHLHRPDAGHIHIVEYGGPPYRACCATAYLYPRSFTGYFVPHVVFARHGRRGNW